MLKATGMIDGRPVILLGLSFENLKRFTEAPADTFIQIHGRELGLPHDILIFSGETEDAMAKLVMRWMRPGRTTH